MRVAIPSHEYKEMESEISDNLGNAEVFVILDVRDGKVRNVNSLESLYAKHGSPGDIPHFLKVNEVKSLIVKSINPRMIPAFKRNGITVYSSEDNTVQECVDKLLKDELVLASINPRRRTSEIPIKKPPYHGIPGKDRTGYHNFGDR
ncbi:MAG: hypothetical protein DRP50_02535 [Thermotoga sp.]|nr:NifB/NifX family molybdenum-iron cluster-binding protein [Thermotogota bacterium]RKX55515.1 MAG: hypothetical protein DRP50_02535 [Thermotoga sp.]